MIVWAAADESHDHKQEIAYIVASLVSTGDTWFEFERQWKKCLLSFGIEYFKTNEFRKLSKQFARFDRTQAQAIWDELASIIRSSQIFGLVLAINLKDYHKVRIKTKSDKTLPPNPYRNAYHTSLIRMALFMNAIQAAPPVAFLLDEHSQAKNLIASYPSLKKLNPGAAPYLGSLSFGVDEKSPALQAADLVAGVCKNHFVDLFQDSTTDSEKQLLIRKLGPYIRMGYVDEAVLLKLVAANVLKKGRPSIYSSLQQKLFEDMFPMTMP